MQNSLSINNRYKLVPLRAIVQDDIETLFRNAGRGVFICGYPDDEWHSVHGITPDLNYSTLKKRKIFDMLQEESAWISLTECKQNIPTRSIVIDGIDHIGSSYRGRLKQIHMLVQLINRLRGLRKSIDFVFHYNFDLPGYLGAMLAKYIWHKTIYVDFEDDYTTRQRPAWKQFITKLLFKTPDEVIVVNEKMSLHFPKINTTVFNGFADMSYSEKADFSFREDMILLFGGTLDDIRGADVLPDLVEALRKRIRRFTIVVTGTGPLASIVAAWNIPEIKYYGFVSENEYVSLVRSADACLVLQKPDHPFNAGSFPSKIDYFALLKKPIYILERASNRAKITRHD